MTKISNRYQKEAKFLIKKILMVKKDKSEIVNIFTNYESKEQISYDTTTFLKGHGTEIFDLTAFVISDEDKKGIDDFFKSEGVFPKDTGSIFNLYDTESPLKERNFAKFFRTLAKGSYQFLKTFPSLRDKFSIIYADRPENLYNRCKSFAHFRLLQKSMGVEATPECLIFTLNNLIETNKNHPFYLKEGIPVTKSAFSKDETKDQTQENHRQILQWAIDNIQILKNEKLTQSAVSILLNNNYTEKELLEKGFPKISWDHDIFIVQKNRNIEIKKIFPTSHFTNCVLNFNYKLLNANYTMRESDWLLIPQLEQVQYSATDSQKQKIAKIIKNNLKQIDDTIDSPIAEMIFRTPSFLHKGKISAIDFELNLIKHETGIKYLNLFKEKGIDIYEIKEKNGIQYSFFTNAFLSQENMLSSTNNEDLNLLDFFNNAPQDNKDIIIDFFEKNSHKMLEFASMKTNAFKYHFPFLTFISNLGEDMTEELIDNTINAFSDVDIKKRVLDNAITSTSNTPNNISILNAIGKLEVQKQRIIAQSILSKGVNDDTEDNTVIFKI